MPDFQMGNKWAKNNLRGCDIIVYINKKLPLKNYYSLLISTIKS